MLEIHRPLRQSELCLQPCARQARLLSARRPRRRGEGAGGQLPAVRTWPGPQALQWGPPQSVHVSRPSRTKLAQFPRMRASPALSSAAACGQMGSGKWHGASGEIAAGHRAARRASHRSLGIELELGCSAAGCPAGRPTARAVNGIAVIEGRCVVTCLGWRPGARQLTGTRYHPGYRAQHAGCRPRLAGTRHLKLEVPIVFMHKLIDGPPGAPKDGGVLLSSPVSRDSLCWG